MVNLPNHCWAQLSKSSWKKSLFLTCQILGLLANTLATDEKYPVLNRDNLRIPIQMQLSRKHETFSKFFAKFLKSIKTLKYFEKKDDPHRFLFPKIRTPKTWSHKRLKSIFSDDPLTNNMVNVAKHCWNQHQCTFVLLIDHWKVNWVGKSLCYWHAKYWECLLTH